MSSENILKAKLKEVFKPEPSKLLKKMSGAKSMNKFSSSQTLRSFDTLLNEIQEDLKAKQSEKQIEKYMKEYF